MKSTSKDPLLQNVFIIPTNKKKIHQFFLPLRPIACGVAPTKANAAQQSVPHGLAASNTAIRTILPSGIELTWLRRAASAELPPL